MKFVGFLLKAKIYTELLKIELDLCEVESVLLSLCNKGALFKSSFVI